MLTSHCEDKLAGVVVFFSNKKRLLVFLSTMCHPMMKKGLPLLSYSEEMSKTGIDIKNLRGHRK